MKADRLERQRDDPYYIGSNSVVTTPGIDDEDIDSIPIVQLSLDFATSVSKRTRQPPPRVPTPPAVHVEMDGELPEGAELVQLPSRPKLVEVSQIVVSPAAEEVKADEGVVTKVVKKKRKESSSGKSKKKKDVLAAGEFDTVTNL